MLSQWFYDVEYVSTLILHNSYYQTVDLKFAISQIGALYWNISINNMKTQKLFSGHETEPIYITKLLYLTST